MSPLRELAASEAGSDQAKFITVAAQRGVNRVARAIRDANAAIEACFVALSPRANEGRAS